MTRPDLIIGGGLAGAGLAIRLAEAGRPVVLLEREAGPHDKVCGEFLSTEAIGSLRRLGVDPFALGAVAIDRVALCVGAHRVEVALPFPALSLSRRLLDEALLVRAAAVGAEVRRGMRVRSLARSEAGWVAQTGAGEVAGAEAFLATGKHDLRGWRRPAGRQSDLVGFKTHLTSCTGLGTGVELHLFPGGYAGLEPVGGGQANLSLVVRRGALAALGGRWSALAHHLLRHRPDLARRLDGEALAAAHPLAIAAIPYGYVRTCAGDGAWRLGDQAAVIPSFAGEGMAIALHSAELAADVRLAGGGPEVFQRGLAKQVRAQIAGATLISQALVRPWGQAVAGQMARRIPGLVRQVARRTRLPGWRAVKPA